MSRECLQQTTGSCAGCNIIEIAINELHTNGICRDPKIIQKFALEIEAEWCPSGSSLNPDLLKPSPKSIW